MFDSDLTRACDDAVRRWGINPRDFYETGVADAICDGDTHRWPRGIGDHYDWSSA